MLQCEGSNITALWRHGSVLALERLKTNDTHAVLRTYGASIPHVTELSRALQLFGMNRH
jgi:hypothetical protein